MINIQEKIKIYGWRLFIMLLINEIKRRTLGFIRNSYSQFGEDLIIDKLLGYKKKGFYVDIGAYDPNHFSNTKRFYKRGWSGINIEPNYNNYRKFVKKRKRDINLNIGIGRKRRRLLFYRFRPSTLSTFSKKEAGICKRKGAQLVDCVKVGVERLDKVLSLYYNGREIDFMTIDVEGWEMEVINSNDWKKFRPKLLCIEYVEHFRKRINKKAKEDQEIFWLKLGYRKAYNNGINFIYKRIR